MPAERCSKRRLVCDVAAIPPYERAPCVLWGRRASRPRRALGKVGFQRRVIAQTRVAPRVVIQAADRLQLGRGEDVIDPPATVVARYPLPGPARLGMSVSVEGAVCVTVAKVLQAGDDAEFGCVPIGAPFWPQAPTPVTRERDHLTRGQLSPRRVEVTAYHARPRPGDGDVVSNPAQSLRLDPAVCRIGDVDAEDLDRTAAGFGHSAECRLRPRHRRESLNVAQR